MHSMRQIALAAVLSSTALLGCAREKAGTSVADTSRSGPAATTTAADVDARVPRADSSRIMGSSAASVWVLIVSDFQCPYCKEFHDDRAAQLRKEFVETGKVRFAYVHFPLKQHANAVPAAEASMCAGAQDRFWPYHDALFAAVDAWIPAAAPQAEFERIATTLNLDLTAFRQCLQDDVMIPMIEADLRRGVEATVKSTPTFLIGDVMIPGVAPLDVFRQAINKALAAAK
jgi:protein-disulfide isomerase